ncbi:methyl-accepting chemotaxis protein [Clostridium sp.]|uniref:methyl-accepting chemotaxis protein n=1 Tax=Clostridium sp. TaxID=1506 RepID=UPI002FDCBD9F
MKSLKSKFTAAICGTCIIVLFFSIVISYAITYNALNKQITDKTLITSQKYSEMINSWLSVQGQFLEDISDDLETNSNFNKEDIISYMTHKAKTNSYVTDVYIGFSNEEFWDGSGWIPPAGYACTKRDWYKKTIKNNKLTYSAPYLDAITNKMIITIGKPLSRNGQVLGVVGTDIYIDTITKIVEKAKPVANSYAYLFDDENNIIVHPNKSFKPTEKELKNINKVMDGSYKQVLTNNKGSSGITLTDYDKIKRYFTSAEISSSKWTVGLAIPTVEFKKPLNNLIYAYIIIALIFTIISAIFSLAFGNKITKPLIELSKIVNKTRDLDLSPSGIDYNYVLKYKDEVGTIGTSIRKLREQLKTIIITLNNNSDEVHSQSDKVSSSMNKTFRTMKEITNSMEAVAKGSTDQAEEISTGLDKLNVLSNKINKVTKNSAEVIKYSKTTEKINKNVSSSVRELYLRLNERSNAAKKVSENISILSDKSDSIGNIVQTIESIAKQTNLLALNAAIEAASAGAYGKGFAVVAEEIRKLAEQTSNSTQEISAMVNEIQLQINNTKITMDRTRELSKTANMSMTQSEKHFETINTSISNMISIITELNSEITEINKDKNSIITSIENISAISQESAAASEEVSASIKEQEISFEVINTSAQRLKSIVTELNNLVHRFKIS